MLRHMEIKDPAKFNNHDPKSQNRRYLRHLEENSMGDTKRRCGNRARTWSWNLERFEQEMAKISGNDENREKMENPCFDDRIPIWWRRKPNEVAEDSRLKTGPVKADFSDICRLGTEILTKYWLRHRKTHENRIRGQRGLEGAMDVIEIQEYQIWNQRKNPHQHGKFGEAITRNRRIRRQILLFEIWI